MSSRPMRYSSPVIAGFSGIFLAFALSGCGGGYGDDGGSGSGSSQVTSISITPVEATITSDGTQQFDADVTGSGTVAGVRVEWRSSETGIATIDADGLATAVAAGTTTITARVDNSSVYGEGLVVTSNEATLTVTSETSIMGLAAAPKPIPNSLVILHDRDGTSQTTLTGPGGRFSLSVAGLSPPFVLQVRDEQGRSLFGAATRPGVANINPVTDVLVRSWYRANGGNADAAFNGPHPAAGPGARELEGLSGAMEKAFREALAAESLARRDFSFFTTPYAAGGPGFDRVLARLHASVGSSGMAVYDKTSGRTAEVIFTSSGGAALHIRSGSGSITAIPLLPALLAEAI